ncbi:hypothetical protein AK812_SmicGene38028 [Symbiodinium microadriaticum]|uniref:Uncharacterized protein n=1 Tax=Symbiodinium microadriaticum TaxID=2951 RepID=A0A1Q9CEU2_SYMMI|nr:hypothetical protein AK812_SmicGene38028 [Symbiodinium microadriaticum]
MAGVPCRNVSQQSSDNAGGGMGGGNARAKTLDGEGPWRDVQNSHVREPASMQMKASRRREMVVCSSGTDYRSSLTTALPAGEANQVEVGSTGQVSAGATLFILHLGDLFRVRGGGTAVTRLNAEVIHLSAHGHQPFPGGHCFGPQQTTKEGRVTLPKRESQGLAEACAAGGLGLAGYNSCFSVIQRADKLCPQRIGDWTYVAVLNDEAGKGQFLDMH